jgi:ADP-ribose pyrophosphatase YjhB (NUDIX family)
MARASQAALTVQAVVFGFDPDPSTPSNRALQVLTVRTGVPTADVERGETCAEAALRACTEAGLDLEGGRRGNRGHRSSLHLVGLGDEPGRGSRALVVQYYGTAPFGEIEGSGRWAAMGRSLRLDAGATAALKMAVERLRADTKNVAGAAALLGDVFTGDDLLRLHIALHGGPKSSERTFRRRVQELRDSGVLRPVRDNEVAALRLRVPRFRSPAGTGGRPPELLRYSGSGGEEEQLAGLRTRRSA